MVDVFAFLIVAALAAALLPRALRGEAADVGRLASLSLVAHLGASVAQIWITKGVYGGGDMFGYYRQGLELARLLRHDFVFFAPEVLSIVFHQPGMVPVPVIGVGSPTGTMSGIAGFLLCAVGDSLYGVTALISSVAFFGKLALYRALAEDVDDDLRKPLFVGVMLVPSVVFWSAGLLKESIAIGPLGFMYAAFRRVVADRRWSSALSLAAGSIAVGLVKPYVLFAFVPSAGAFLYGESARRKGRVATIRPLPMAFAGALAVAGVLALGAIFPEFALDQVAEAAAAEQAVGQRARGGSSYSIGDPMARSLGGQLAFAPIAIVSSLFRPFLFEARNAQSFVSAVEATAILLLTVRAVLRTSWTAMWNQVLRSPMLMFCLSFALTLGLPVGLASTNLGTLSRYRMPLLPFFAAVVMLWNADLLRARRR